jgi:hypothetical protein
MTKKDIDNLIIQISSDVAAIKQHLKDMNGKLIRHDKQLDKYPEIHRQIDFAIDNLKTEVVKVKTKNSMYVGLASGFAGAVLVAGMNIFVFFITNKLGG